ncbi:hypothetical protein BC629DRAFT_1258578, partial [Irpex lacteus]
VAAHTPYTWLSHAQMQSKLHAMSNELNGLKLKNLNTTRRLQSTVHRINDYKRFAMAIGTTDVPRVKQLVAQGLKQGSSVDMMVTKLREAAAGLYKPRGYEQHDAELAYLAKALGGPRLLFALN